MIPQFDLNKIKFSVDKATFERAVSLYEKKKVTKFKEDAYGFSAVVLGTHLCNGNLGELSKEDLQEIKKEVTSALKYIKAYSGSSRTWFSYQSSLDEGCARLSTIVSKLPVSEQTAKLLIHLLLRLDKKLLTGGVDDSNGTVGGFMEETALMLQDYAKLDLMCTKAFKKLIGKETCFGWEEPLVKIFNELGNEYGQKIKFNEVMYNVRYAK